MNKYVIRDDAPVAAPPDYLGAHDHACLFRRHPEQFAQACAERCRLRIVGIIMKRLTFPGGVDVFLDAHTFPTTPTELEKMDITYFRTA